MGILAGIGSALGGELVSSLFGGGGGGGGGGQPQGGGGFGVLPAAIGGLMGYLMPSGTRQVGTAQTVTTPSWTPDIAAQYQNLLGRAGGLQMTGPTPGQASAISQILSMQPAAANLAGTAAGAARNIMAPSFLTNAWGVPNLQDIAGGVANPAAGALGQMAYNPQADPYANALVSNALGNLANQYTNAVAPQLTSSLGLANRFGSGAAANQTYQLARGLGVGEAQAIPNILSPIFQAQAQRQLGAAQSLGSQALQGQQIAEQAAQAMLGGYGNLAGVQNQATSLMPGILQAMYTPGTMAYNLATSQQQQDWTNLANYMKMIQAANPGAIKTQLDPILANPASSAAGMALAGGAMGPAIGRAISGAVGGMSGVGGPVNFAGSANPIDWSNAFGGTSGWDFGSGVGSPTTSTGLSNIDYGTLYGGGNIGSPSFLTSAPGTGGGGGIFG